ncbi:MAG: sulfatase [Labilibaculum sp.]|nr:sulfatase [Labilibaculum sp.]
MKKLQMIFNAKMLSLLALLAVSVNLFGNTQKGKTTKPNILWLICEDISPYLSFYGDSTAKTPNLDQLAKESLVFTNCFTTVGVCAPSRATLITGMYPTSVGTHHMRTAIDAMGWGRRKYRRVNSKKAVDIKKDTIGEYATVLPEYVKCFSEYLRAEGYYCTNNYKTDYNFAAPVTAWDENSTDASWEDCPEEKPFFSVFTDLITHESQMWTRRRYPMTVNPDSVPVPPYFPDDSIIRNDIARHYSNIEVLDERIGKKIQALKDQGLYDNTIIFFFSDNGGPLPRGKRETLETGLHVPFTVRFPKGVNAGKVEELVSFVDFAPTVLSLAGIKPPKHLQGQVFLGEFRSLNTRSYVYGSGDRFDEYTDKIRVVRDKRYLYIRNYYPELPRYKDVGYRKKMPMMKQLLKLRNEGKLSDNTALWFQTNKPKEELYDCIADPGNLNNLIEDSHYAEKVNELRSALDNWIVEVGDMGSIPEATMIEQMWPGNIQPQTAQTDISISNKEISLSCSTKGSSIAYILSDRMIRPDLDSGWQLYFEPIELEKTKYLYVMANRIGYADSKVSETLLLKIGQKIKIGSQLKDKK